VLVPTGPLRGFWWTAYPWSAYWRGTFEPALTRQLQALAARRGGVYWDVGAHFGYYALQMARAAGPEGQVLAIEANPASFAYLQRHQRWNRLHQMLCYCLAASDRPGRQMLLNYADATSTTAHLAYPDENVAAVPSRREIVTGQLDELAEARNLRAPDLVKIDVEGHGDAVLRGMRRNLERSRPVLFVAVHGERELAGIRAVLEPLGYAAFVGGERVPPGAWPREGDFLFVPPGYVAPAQAVSCFARLPHA
jgi:FkbM family methyltransferase